MPDLNIDDLLRAAKERTGLSHFHSDSWREGLQIFVRDHQRVRMLNDTGRTWCRNLFIDALSTRLRVDDFLKHHPNITKTRIHRPVFILGMPRTGTTMASYLMHADPQRRCLLKWEAYNVVPPAKGGELYTDARCLSEVYKDKEALERDASFAARHYEAADGPTECVHLMAQDFRSVMLDAIATAPTYSDWLLFCDPTPAFEHRKRVYQILQATNPGLWTLKMPSDAVFVRTLFKTFPDAKVIWTHRDPYESVSSSLSMRSYSRGVFNRDPDIAHMRSYFLRQLAFHVSRPLELSRERPQDFYHLYYNELVADPVNQMRKIYAWLGDTLTPEAANGMQRWLDDNPQGRFGSHTHALQKFGLSQADLKPYFSDYLRAHPAVWNKAT